MARTANTADSGDWPRATLGFVNPATVYADPERPGQLRAKYIPIDEDDPPSRLVHHQVPLRSWSAEASAELDLWNMGFDCIDVSAVPGLMEELEVVRKNSYISEKNIEVIRRKLWGRAFRLSNGRRLRILFVAGDGFILRKGGPNALRVNPDEEMTGSNGHGTAPIVHGDQDVFGTPLKQMMKGFAPKIFRHRTAGKVNRSPIHLVNLWLPLQQITQPLTLLDRSTLNQPAHQLRYAFPVDSFLERDEDAIFNDIWMFLYDESQRWYFNSELYAGKAYVFDTLGEAHGGAILPGEEQAERYYLCLQRMCEALEKKDAEAFESAACMPALPLPDDVTPPLRRACERMHAVIEAARSASVDALAAKGWKQRAEQAMDAVVRKSIEMRAVAWVS